MQLHEFTAGHLGEAAALVREIWGDELKNCPAAAVDLIYEYLPRFYFYPDSGYNFGVSVDGRLEALLLAHALGDVESSGEAWWRTHLNSPHRALLEQYRNYLEFNQRAELALAAPGDLILALFASRRSGCGKLLLERLTRQARADGRRNLLLWSDDTCDFEYYHRHGYQELARCDIAPEINGVRLANRLYIFRKSLL